MLASELMAELLKEILTHGDGEVRFHTWCDDEGERVDSVVVYEDEDAFGHVTERRFRLV